MKCPHCQKEFNAGKVMGSAKSPAKTAAAKKRGEWMKQAFAAKRASEAITISGVEYQGATYPVMVRTDLQQPYQRLEPKP